MPGGSYLAEAYRRVFGYSIAGRHEACDLCGSGESVVVGRFDRRLRPLTNVMCTKCGLIRQDPMPTEAELKHLYERDYRLQQKGVAEPSPRDVERNLLRGAARLARLKPMLPAGARILDVGSGAGDFAYLAAQAGFRVRACEPNVGYAEWSKRSFGIDVTNCTWEKIEVPPNSYDLIMSHHVLEHLRSPLAALKKFHEWLKPGGLLWFGVPNLRNSYASPNNRFPVWHVHGFTPETHQMMALKAGFARLPGKLKARTEDVVRRLPAPAEDWFIYPDHAREMQAFFHEHTFFRYLLRGKAFTRIAKNFSDTRRRRSRTTAPAKFRNLLLHRRAPVRRMTDDGCAEHVPVPIEGERLQMSKLTGFGSLKMLAEERVTDKITRKIASGEQGMIVWWSVKAGAHAAAHKHPHEQIMWMLSGRMDFRVGGDMRSCVAGDFAVIPGGVEHEAWFPEDTEVIDVFAPPREDFFAGGPPKYMKKD